MVRRTGRSSTDDDDDGCQPPAVPRGSRRSRNDAIPSVSRNRNEGMTSTDRVLGSVPDTVSPSSASANVTLNHHQNDLLAEKGGGTSRSRTSSPGAVAVTLPRPPSRVAGYNNNSGISERQPSNEVFAEIVPDTVASLPASAMALLHEGDDVLAAKREAAANDSGVPIVPGAVPIRSFGAPPGASISSHSLRSTQTDEGCPPLQMPNRHTGAAFPGAVAVMPRDAEEEEKLEEAESYEEKEKSSNFAPVVAVKSEDEDITNKKQKPQVVERVAGPDATLSDDDMFLDSPIPMVSAELAVAAEVVADEKDIEAQVQARVHEEREEIAAQVQKRLMDQAVHADVVTAEDFEDDKSVCSKRRMILAGILAAVVVAVVVVVVVVVVGKNDDPAVSFITGGVTPTASPTITETPTISPTPEPKCTLCADGSVPEGLDGKEYTLGGEGVTCADLMVTQSQLDLSDENCVTGQAAAWLFCDCPTLPPFPEDATCTLCSDGALSIENPEGNAGNRTCSDWNTFLALIGSTPLLECDALRESVNNCRCDSDPSFMDFLTNLFLPISGNVILQEGTPQNDALFWMAELDRADLTEATSTEELQQRYVLAVLYYSTGGPSWGDQYNFRSGGDICSWNDGLDNGVICNGGVIDSIKLDSNNLIGTIPNELTTLSGLRMIEVRNNKLVGVIPQNIGDLSMLERFDVDLNSMNGVLPASLFEISALKELWLDKNQFAGPLPSTFGNSLALEWFTCNSCNLTGFIPPSIDGLSNLRELDLDSNEFTGAVPTFSRNAILEELYLSNNKLNGTLPATLGSLSRLESLAIGTNFLTGTIPPAIGSLPSLTGVDFQANFLIGDIPPFTGGQISLLFFQGNLLDGNLYEFFNSSSLSLTAARFEENRISGSIPETVGKFLAIEDFDLAENQMSGSIPTSIGNLAKVEFVHLHATGLTGAIPTELGLMSSVKGITLGGNDLNGTVPTELGNLVALTELTFANCGLVGSFPSSVANLPLLEFLSVNGNMFTNNLNDTFCSRDDPIDTFFSDCLVETVSCPCCSHCCNVNGVNCVENPQ